MSEQKINCNSCLYLSREFDRDPCLDCHGFDKWVRRMFPILKFTKYRKKEELL